MSGRSEPPTLHFVLTTSHHGATLLALLLNAHPDVAAPADTNPSRRIAQACWCGAPIGDCDFWAGLYRALDLDRFREFDGWMPRFPRLTGAPGVDRRLSAALGRTGLAVSPAVWGPLRGRLADFCALYEGFRLYALRRTGARVLVDGEKSLAKALVLAGSGRYRVRILHLVREPRGFVASYRRQSGGTTAAAARHWRRQHGRILAFARALPPAAYLRLRYEDLVDSPANALSAVQSFLGLAEHDLLTGFRRPPGKHAVGNKMMFNFAGTISRDERWRSELSPEEQAQALALARPLAARFGYTS